MAKGYVIAHIKIKDPVLYKQYVGKVFQFIRKTGAKFTVRGGEATQLEGKELGTKHVIVEYPSYEEALRWYESEEYQKIAALRHESTESDLIIVEGA